MNSQIEYIWFHAMLQLLTLASIAGLLGGTALILRPAWLAQWGKRANRWVSTRKVDKSLESWISLDKWFYQYHRLTGGLMLAGALWVIAYFIIAFNRHGTAALFFRDTHFLPPELVDILLDLFVIICMGGAAFSLLVGSMLLLIPAVLRDFEQWTNQLLSLRKALKPVEVPRPGVDEYVIRHARPAGVLLLLGSLYILAALLFSMR